ncbi:hypothetical protein NESM_000087300 [Novymonas esmeraldas]|uniref:Knr4/Smi1-like domain-containing protein n=1 Tax=Novymonas esmeraldas TaxID=1808958 RepID=A0AAW0F4I2_9TRYP
MPKGPRTADVSRRLVDAYVTALRQHLPTYCIRQLDKLPKAQEHQLTRLRQSYPGPPVELLYLLQRVNGTCWETLQAPHGSAPPPPPPQSTSPSATATATVTEAQGGTVASTTATATTAALPSSPSSASPTPTFTTSTTATTTVTTTTTTTATTTPAAAAVDGDASTTSKAAAPASAAAGAAAKSATKATAAAAMASEAAAFIKSQIAKKVNTMAAPRHRRPLPRYVALPILGSTYTNCPYYLKSVDQMLVAEQQFPPLSATLPDEGEAWAPTPPPPPPTPSHATAAATSSPSAPLHTSSTSDHVTSADTTESPPPPPSSTAATAGLNTHSIASVYAGCKIVHSAAPSPTPPPSTDAAPAVSLPGATPPEAEPRVVYVDPRIDIHASFHQWLAFADGVQPHVRGSTPTMPDADPARMAAAAAAAAAAGGGGGEGSSGGAAAAAAAQDTKPFSLARAPSQTYTPPPPPKQFAASRLYVDFKPVEQHGGVCGQVIQFVHGKPDSFSVVAENFGDYLKHIMAEEYEFTEELEEDDDDDDDDDEEDGVVVGAVNPVAADAAGGGGAGGAGTSAPLPPSPGSGPADGRGPASHAASAPEEVTPTPQK